METTNKTNAQDKKYILDIPQLLWKWKIWILLASFLCAMVSLLISRCCITPLYKTYATLYVSNGSSLENPGYITSSDLSASSQLVDTYAAIILSDAILEDVISDCSLDISIDELADILEINSVNGTEVFTVAVQYTDAEKAAEIVNSITEIAPKQIDSIINGSSVTVINNARVPTRISYPNYKKIAMTGFVIGMVIVGGYILIKEMMDSRVKSVADFARWEYPLLVSIPDFKNKERHEYGYGAKSKGNKHTARTKQDVTEEKCYVLSEDTPFSIREAYNTLRTNILFSSPDKKKKIIVVTSSIESECKSTTAINLALSFAQNQAKVLLMDCDLRLPSIADKLALNQSPGLTDLMLEMGAENKVIYIMKNGIHVMPSGTIPPNPTVMLGSDTMKKILQVLTEHYDYIILDTPPLETMPDASILSKYATDVVLVVRQNTSTKSDVDGVISKLELAKANILGFAFTCVAEDGKKSYQKYNDRYGYSGKKRSPQSMTAFGVNQKSGHKSRTSSRERL